MRISNKDNLANLGKHAQKQVQAALDASEKEAKEKNVTLGKTQKPSKRTKPKRIVSDPITNTKYCPIPPTDPGAWLHIALNQKYGSYEEGGHHAHEVIIPGHDRKFRWDHIIYGMVCIELDGYGYHFDLNSFKRDREKQKHALINGFIVHRVTAQNIKENLAGVLLDIDKMLEHHPRYTMRLSKVGKTQYRLDERHVMHEQ